MKSLMFSLAALVFLSFPASAAQFEPGQQVGITLYCDTSEAAKQFVRKVREISESGTIPAYIACYWLRGRAPAVIVKHVHTETTGTEAFEIYEINTPRGKKYAIARIRGVGA